MSIKIIIDPLPEASRVAVMREGRLISLFQDQGPAAPPAPGAVVVVRVDRVFPERRMIACDLGGSPASLRWPGSKGKASKMPDPGQRLVATVAAEAREDKPLQLRRGVVIEDGLMIVENGVDGLHVSRRLAATGYTPPPQLVDQCKNVRLTLRQGAMDADQAVLTMRAEALIAEANRLAAMETEPPGVIKDGPDAAMAAASAFPGSAMITDDDGAFWQQADLDSLIDKALLPQQVIAGGGRLHINTPPGAAVIDGDSGDSDRPPFDLARAMVTPVTEALMLRRISGPVVVDFPRLDKASMQQIDTAVRAAADIDPLRPQCHGFTQGGLYTMTRPWRWQPLDRLMADTARHQGIAAIRLARRMAAMPAAGVVQCSPLAHDWIKTEGAVWTAEVMKGLARLIEFRSDNAVNAPQFTRR